MTNEESVFNLELSYSEIDTLLFGLFAIAKNCSESEAEKVYAINRKLRDSRTWENVSNKVKS